ncbi:MAG: hypothetical protein JO193_06370 [Candidatus Eremiobacteraeota bacterium]|nr:hypothetical protein [Candidatus Eremiobacteraeota bacterium]
MPFHRFRIFIALALVGVVQLAGSDSVFASNNEPQYLHVSMRSAALTSFWGQPVSIDAHILLPDSYYKQPARRYPVFYWIQGFNGRGDIDVDDEVRWQKPMRRSGLQFILVFLNGMFDGGHQEFADSANNGPWGTALTTEFIPRTEERFRAIDAPAARFVGGHSSGGWSALWLQVTYPELFGGEWSLSPDPVDFRNFTGPNLTLSPPQNFFNDPSGQRYMLYDQPMSVFVKRPGWQSMQMLSFEQVFSPKGADGKPERLFDRNSGVIDPNVASYWEAHYDISRILQDHWDTLAPQLRGKLHIFVGSNDNFQLNESVDLLKQRLDAVHSDAEITIARGLDHWSIFTVNGDAIAYILQEAETSLQRSNDGPS